MMMEDLAREMRKIDLYKIATKPCFRFGRYEEDIFIDTSHKKPELHTYTGIIKGVANIKRYIILHELVFEDLSKIK